MIPSKTWLYIIAGVAIIGGLFLFIEHQRSVGRDAERAKQEKENATFQVNQHKGAVAYDTCDAAGGLYDFSKGTCKLGTAR